MFDFASKKTSEEFTTYQSDEKGLRPQMPPCPNGCGNEDIEQIKNNNHPQLKEIRSLHPHLDPRTQIQFFFCKTCLSLFIIKIKMDEMTEGESLPLAA